MKPKTILLKGIDNSFKASEILNEINNMNLANVDILKISEFTTKKSIRDNKQLPFYIIQTTPNSGLKTLTNIRYILHQTVRWEKIIKNESTMCSRCQRAGHSSSNCYLDFRCVKCAENHEPGNCAIKKRSKNR